MQLPVLIVGAGPVGLSLAIALTRQGVQVELFEELPELSGEIRASTFHPPTLEMFAEWGVLNAVQARGQRVDQLLYWERRTREQIACFNYADIADATAYPFRLQCPQAVLTRTLLPILARSPLAKVHMAHRLASLVQHADSVSAHFVAPAGAVTVKGTYLCGADGANSTVRRQLGLAFDGLTYADRFLLAGVDFDLQPYFPGIGPVNYMYDPEEWVIVLHLPDVVRIVFRMREAEDADAASEETAIRARIARFLGVEAEFHIKSVSVYRVHQRVAETFRVRRVLLLGDAAHINNPAGGMGMNSGIHDAHYLANCLVSVLRADDERLLDDYAGVRRRVALELVRGYSDRNYLDLSAADEAYRQQRNEQLRATANDPQRARAFLLEASMLSGRI